MINQLLKWLKRKVRENAKSIIGILILLLFLPAIFLAGREAVTLFIQAKSFPANIVVDVSRSQGDLKRPWMGLSQGGEQEAPGQLVSIAPVTAQVKSLGTKYIRIDHVLEDPFWATRKERIQEIINTGAIPFISLSYFPSTAANSNIGTVYNWDAWQSRVRQLVSEVSGRNGMNISGVYYEVWNEPDGESFGNFRPGEGKDYFVLYQKTVDSVLSASNTNSYKIGGPALADLRRCSNNLLFICNEFWLDKFLALVAQNNTRLDFISWHRYATKLSDYQEDTNFILNLFTKHANLPRAEMAITEWGSRPERNPVHNSTFDAAHLVAAARTFIGYVDIATKFEIRDGPESGNNGWGIFYHNGQKKPSAVALEFLNNLRSGKVLLSGEGTFVTGIASRDSSGLSIILSNYDAESSNVENVPVKIVGLIPGRYRLTKSVINNRYPLGNSQTSIITTEAFPKVGQFETQETFLPNMVVLYNFQLIELSQ